MTRKCDACGDVIEGLTIGIGEYGVTFHNICFRTSTGPEMLRYLGVDDALMYDDVSGPQTRLRDPRGYTGEEVYWL